jgi:hypothetical protein
VYGRTDTWLYVRILVSVRNVRYGSLYALWFIRTSVMREKTTHVPVKLTIGHTIYFGFVECM